MYIKTWQCTCAIKIVHVHQEHGIRCTHLSTANENGSPCLGRMKEYCGDGGGLDGAGGTGSKLQQQNPTVQCGPSKN